MKKMYGYFGLIISVVFITLFTLGLAIFADISTKEKISILVIVAILFVIVGIFFDLFSKRAKREKY
jgi:hypothetical protein